MLIRDAVFGRRAANHSDTTMAKPLAIQSTGCTPRDVTPIAANPAPSGRAPQLMTRDAE